MTGKDVLAMQLGGSFALIAEELSNAERLWTRRAFAGGNPPGFTLWHCARTIDWGVQCAIRGLDEVAFRPRWRALMPPRFLFGAGISAAAAEELAQALPPAAVAEYSQDVRTEVLSWLDKQSDATLAAVPDFRANNEKRPAYMDPAVWSEIESLEGIPAWQVLARPCISHVRVHVGEVGAILQTLDV